MPWHIKNLIFDSQKQLHTQGTTNGTRIMKSYFKICKEGIYLGWHQRESKFLFLYLDDLFNKRILVTKEPIVCSEAWFYLKGLHRHRHPYNLTQADTARESAKHTHTHKTHPNTHFFTFNILSTINQYTTCYQHKSKTKIKGEVSPNNNVDWVSRKQFHKPNSKVWADLDNPFKRSDYAKLCMLPSLDGTRPEYVISQEDNSPLTLYIDFHNFQIFLDINSPFDPVHS